MTTQQRRWQVDGKFFRLADRRVVMQAVTYGPFVENDQNFWPREMVRDFAQMHDSGCNGIRIYRLPTRALLDAAHAAGLSVWAGIAWAYGMNFRDEPCHLTQARVLLADALRELGDHPAWAGVYVANEVPSDMVRWMGVDVVRSALEGLISLGKSLAPQLLFAYATYPSTEYLQPANADFCAFNVYLEEEKKFDAYLARLHHLAGDRPLVIAEFGIDSKRNGTTQQAATLDWGLRLMQTHHCAGMTIFSWTDRWWNHGKEVLDWEFGVTDRERKAKPSQRVLREHFLLEKKLSSLPLVSVIVCTRNGSSRIVACIESLLRLRGKIELIIVNDGSTDDTADLVREKFPQLLLLDLSSCGLSAARNAGAAIAQGEILAYTDDDCVVDEDWIIHLCEKFLSGQHDAVGGPNIPPTTNGLQEIIVTHAGGAAAHVMLDDQHAEHIPGCNLAVTARAFHSIGGFDPQFRTAGDDVDFCWRLLDAGLSIGFAPTAFVWHYRRQSILAYIRQQRGYGKAEALLIAKHPQRFQRGQGASWQGCVYTGGPMRAISDSIVYYGVMATASYQMGQSSMTQDRLHTHTPAWMHHITHAVSHCAAWLRKKERMQGSRMLQKLLENPRKGVAKKAIHSSAIISEFSHSSARINDRQHYLRALLLQGWSAGSSTDHFDLTKNGTTLTIATEQSRNPLTRHWFRATDLTDISELRAWIIALDSAE
jgi:GT2 family glycosyltransferase